MRGKLFIITVLLASAIFFTGTEGFSQEVKIGFYIALSGPVSTVCGPMKKAAMMIVDDWNAHGGILGKPVKLIMEDDQGSSSQSVSVVQKFVDKDKVPLIIGGVVSSGVLASSLVNEKAKVPQIVHAAIAEKITQRGLKYVFRSIPTFDQLFVLLGEYWMTKTPYKRYAIFAEATDSGESIQENMTKQIEGRGGKIVAVFRSPTGTSDFYSRLTRVKELSPEVIFLGYPSLTDNAQIIRQTNELGIKAVFTATESASMDRLFDIVGDGAEGSVFTSFFEPGYPTTPLAKKLLNDYRAKYNEDPDWAAAKTYEAFDIGKHAIEKAGSLDPQKIRDALASIKNYPGICAPTTFDETGQAYKNELLVKVQGRKRIPIQ
jgi:branched-chain amino acid transport system substrate-binding protein